MKVVVYCSANADLPQEVTDIASALGQWIGEGGHSLVYGGVNAGLMHVTAQAAVDAGCHDIQGIVPEFFAHRADPLCTSVTLARDLNHRKALLYEKGDVFVVLPGGLGTIDEWISTLSARAVDGSDKPIIVVNHEGMYDALAQQLANTGASCFSRSPVVTSSIFVDGISDLLHQLQIVTNAIEK